jgi:hypothetical protein
MRGVMRRFLRSLSLWGQPVLLEAAVWLAGDGHFDEAVGQCGCQIEQAEALACTEAERCLQAVAVHLAAQDLEQLSDLGCDLGCLKSFGNDLQHEIHERCAGALLGACVEGGIVVGLVGLDEAFDREIGEERVPAAEDEGSPESSHAAIAILKGVDEFKLVVEDGAGHQRVCLSGGEPIEQITHLVGDAIGRWGDMHDALLAHHASGSGAIGAGRVDQARHGCRVRIQQIRFGQPGRHRARRAYREVRGHSRMHLPQHLHDLRAQHIEVGADLCQVSRRLVLVEGPDVGCGLGEAGCHDKSLCPHSVRISRGCQEGDVKRC